MRRKIAVILTMAMILAGVTACGSKGADAAGQNETAAEAQDTGNFAEAKEAEPMPEPTPEPTPEPVEKPVWYMDSEGLKSEELGMMIRKDSADWSKFGFSGSVIIDVSKTASGTTSNAFAFDCYCYEGDLDSYISENKGTEKSAIGDIPFAVDSTFGRIVFVGNGISLFVWLSDYHIEDIWEKGLESYDEANYDYLAYIKDGDLYCPALGIKIYSTNDTGVDMSSRSIVCSDRNAEKDSKVGRFSIFSFGTAGVKESAQERLDEWVENRENYGATVLEETVERSVGNCHYVGMCSVDNYGKESWQFCSDETGWDISIDCSEGYNWENYLSYIEELK